MIDWIIGLFRSGRTDHVDIQLTSPAEKRAAEERARQASLLVWLLEEQARSLTNGADDRGSQ